MSHHTPLHAPADEVMKYLDGVNYPADRLTLMEHARKGHAPKNVLRSIEIMYAEKFSNPDDVKRNLESSEARDESATQRHQSGGSH